MIKHTNTVILAEQIYSVFYVFEKEELVNICKNYDQTCLFHCIINICQLSRKMFEIEAARPRVKTISCFNLLFSVVMAAVIIFMRMTLSCTHGRCLLICWLPRSVKTYCVMLGCKLFNTCILLWKAYYDCNFYGC